MDLTTLKGLFVEQLKDVYSAEKQLMMALPVMAESATNIELADAFRDHLNETADQVVRLEEAFGCLGLVASSHTCEAMRGLIAESEDIIAKRGVGVVRDVGLIASAQRIEHYEIAAYEMLMAIAGHLDESECKKLFEDSLGEEEHASKKLRRLVEGGWITSGIAEDAAEYAKG